MNVERLQEILREVQRDFKQTDIEGRLERLAPLLQRIVDEPTVPDYQSQVAGELNEIYNALRSAPSTEYGPVWEHSVQELHLANFLAGSLIQRIQAIFQNNQITPAVAVSEIQQLRLEISDARQRVEQTLSGLDFLHVTPNPIPADKAEVGILIPRAAVDNKLDELGSRSAAVNARSERYCRSSHGPDRGC